VHLATERLLLLPLARQHAEGLASVYADEDVARYIGGVSLDAATTAAQVARFESVWTTLGYGQSAVIVRASGEFIGRVGLHPWPQWDEVEVGWVLARHAQRQGYAGEAASAWLQVAFSELALPRLIAVIHPDNQRSRSLAERLGFTVHRDDVSPSGVNVLVYERLAPGAE
jgi:RimJ/RimL family protein N-acetyltransferase